MRPAILAVGMLCAVSACTDDAPILATERRVAVAMVLSQDLTSSDSALYAVVYDAGSSGLSTYRSVEQIEMRRRSDGALFAWETIPRSGGFSPSPTSQPSSDLSNLRLPWNGTGGALGRADLAGGETYDLHLVSEGLTVTGVTTLPGRPSPTEDQQDRLVFEWEAVPFAATYAVRSDAELLGFSMSALTRFEHTRLKPVDEWPSPAWLRVTALDANLARFWTEPSRASAGLTGAIGVFGAAATDSAVVTPPSSLRQRH